MTNAAIRNLDLAAVHTTLDRGVDAFYVCDATETQWRQYVQSDSQLFHSRAMEWRQGRLYIVEPSSSLHGSIVGGLSWALSHATGTDTRHLCAYGDVHAASIGDFQEPDLSFGPDVQIGTNKPPDLKWNEFHTLKVETGVSCGWLKLEQKAQHWATIPGVAYVLLIRVASPDTSIQEREFTLYEVVHVANVLRTGCDWPSENAD